MSTIAAIGTAIGNSGISIIRISGKDSLNIISKIFTSYKKLTPNSIYYGKIIDAGNIVDNVLVSYFKAPNSFTGEDICEINCHGGTYITQKILDIVLKNGAILAGPGEFSKRAFLNGKMDLSEAESIIDLINSKTQLEAKIATDKLNGSLKQDITNIREDLINILAHIDVNVDYPEYDYEQLEIDSLNTFLDEKINRLGHLIDTYQQGKYIKNGVNVTIIGKPNSGKSSLLNNLSKKNRAIVTDIEGTTRDIITETVDIGDLILNINDTAGIRDTEDVIEKIGVEKSLEMLDTSDLILYIFDPSKKIEENEIKLISKIENKGFKIIYLINKMDEYDKLIFSTFMDEILKLTKNEVLKISAKENLGIEELKIKIKQMFLNDELDHFNENIIVSERHKELLMNAYNMLIKAKEEINIDMPIDMISLNIKEAGKYLGQIIGKDISVDVSNKVFEKFCIGK